MAKPRWSWGVAGAVPAWPHMQESGVHRLESRMPAATEKRAGVHPEARRLWYSEAGLQQCRFSPQLCQMLEGAAAPSARQPDIAARAQRRQGPRALPAMLACSVWGKVLDVTGTLAWPPDGPVSVLSSISVA